MSKIIINEIDNTTRSLGEYQNFTVVVPGFIASDKTGEGFDDNGIIELHKLADFNEYIGKVKSAKISAKAVAPTLTVFETIPGTPTEQDLEPDPIEINWKKVSLTDFVGKYTNCIYKPVPQTETTNIGYLKGAFKLVKDSEIPQIDTYYEFTKVTTETFSEDEYYVCIEDGAEGVDQADYTSQGNHMAYELLSLGYTVLFKKLNMEPSEPEDGETIEPITPADELAQMDTAEFWACLKDKSTYDFRYITTGGYTARAAYEQIGAVATFRKGDDVLEPAYPEGGTAATLPGRGDCTALIDFPEEYVEGSGTDKDKYNLQKVKANQSKLIQTIRDLGNKLFSNNLYINEYSKLFIPNVIYDLGTDNIYNPTTDYVTFPGSFHYLACAARAYRNVREWFAVAGYDNGISDFKVVGTTLTLGEIATTALQPRIGYQDEKAFNKGINIITKIRGSYYLWGNRTAHEIKLSGLIASDFANIRELCTSLKKVIYIACKQLTFSPNSDLLWVSFCNKVRPLLDAMKANEGVKDYAFVKVPTDKKAVMLGKIRIVPIEAVEDFELDLFLENSLEGQVVEVEEN